MRFLDHSRRDPAENLALDEALLDEHEARASGAEAGDSCEVLRIWESPVEFVVLGSASRIDDEVLRERCAAEGVPVLRRHSGGGTVLQGPGCLNYTLVLSLAARPALRNFTRSYRKILGATATALGPGVAQRGISDLVSGEHKFSGNAQRRRAHTLLHHATILYDFDLARITALLAEPPRQPDYREHRPHADFITNLKLERDEIVRRLRTAWQAGTTYAGSIPCLDSLVAAKYGDREWTERF